MSQVFRLIASLSCAVFIFLFSPSGEEPKIPKVVSWLLGGVEVEEHEFAKLTRKRRYATESQDKKPALPETDGHIVFSALRHHSRATETIDLGSKYMQPR